jgi:hypothetical protein
MPCSFLSDSQTGVTVDHIHRFAFRYDKFLIAGISSWTSMSRLILTKIPKFEELGLVYLPYGSPPGVYGGDRKGTNWLPGCIARAKTRRASFLRSYRQVGSKQRMDRERRAAVVEYMVERGAQLSEHEVGEVVEYLASSFGQARNDAP